MKNATNKKQTTKTETKTDAIKMLTIADVARELNIAPKKLRAVLRKNAKQYAPFRKTRFAANSDLHKRAIETVKTLFTKPVAA